MTRPAVRSKQRWAPWWLYLVLFLALNYVRQWLVPFGTVPEWVDVVLALAIAAAVGVAVTLAYRRLRTPRL
jgi:hypothetical protein